MRARRSVVDFLHGIHHMYLHMTVKGGGRAFESRRVHILIKGVMMSDCIFCKLSQGKEAHIAETENLFAVWDKFPASKGHAMIIPKRHIVNMFEMNEQEGKELPVILNKVKAAIESKYNGKKPTGYNIGSNNGETAGQIVMHLHIHVLPRYVGGDGIQLLGKGEPKE